MKKNISNRLDLILAITISMFCLTTIIGSLKLLNLNFAILNFAFTIIPWILIIFTNKFKFPKKFFIYFILIFSLKTLSLMHNSYGESKYDLLTNLYYYVSFFVSFFAIYFCYLPNFDNKIFLKKTCYVVIIFTLIFCIYNLYINKGNFNYISIANSSYDLKFASFFSNRNNFGKFLFLSIVLLLFSEKNNYIGKKFFALLFIFIIFNLLLTFSRTAIFCTMIFLIFNIPFDKLKNKKAFLFIPIIVIFLLLSINYINSNKAFVDKFYIRENSGFTGRDNIWRNALSIIKNNAILGVGEIKSQKLLNKLTSNSYYHNSFLKEFAMYGIFEGIILILFMLFFVQKLFCTFSYNTEKKYIFGLFISLILYSLFEEFIFFGTGYINFMYSFYLFCFIPILTYTYKGGGKID
ncbi:MAG: oligosaccharide repeat unit polymerase [Bacilli bacterium]|nr:oligosaccharide repeat unit polymerase [Bacilli bacterium]